MHEKQEHNYQAVNIPNQLFKKIGDDLVQYSIYQAKGAFLNGSLVEKTNSNPDDTFKDGKKGTVLGSVGPVDLEHKYGYFILFENDDFPRFIAENRVILLKEPSNKSDELTMEKLEMLANDYIFAFGKLHDYPDHISIANTGKELHWVAKKGGIDDWSIYVQYAYWDEREGIKDEAMKNDIEMQMLAYLKNPYLTVELFGNKLMGNYAIRKLVPSTDEVYERYRS